MEEILPKVQFNLLNSSAYYRYLSRRIGAIVETTLSALKYQGTYSKFMPKHFETSFRRKPRTNDELIAQTLTTTQGIPINIRVYFDHDGGVDDLVSLFLLLQMENVQLIGVSTIGADCYLEPSLSASVKLLIVFQMKIFKLRHHMNEEKSIS